MVQKLNWIGYSGTGSRAETGPDRSSSCQLPTNSKIGEKEVADRANQNFSAFTLNFLSTHKICLIKIFVQNL